MAAKNASQISINRDRDALLIVDLQNDFCPGGALGVEDGDQVIAPFNALIPHFETIVASQDWHPENHCSFADLPEFVDKSWPVHCVAGSPGAELHADLELPEYAHRVRKATTPERDAYSAFDETGLEQWLRDKGITRIFAGGLATDYCVKASVLAACKAGFETYVLRDAVRAVAEQDGALAEMVEAGAKLIDSSQLVAGGDA